MNRKPPFALWVENVDPLRLDAKDLWEAFARYGDMCKPREHGNLLLLLLLLLSPISQRAGTAVGASMHLVIQKRRHSLPSLCVRVFSLSPFPP